MGEFLRVLHSFNFGDCVSILAGLKAIYDGTGQRVILYQRLDFPAGYYKGAEHSTLNEDGQGVSMNWELFLLLSPLIKAQKYIEDFLVWEGQEVDLNYDQTRNLSNNFLQAGSLHHLPSLVFPQMVGNYSEPWIDVDYNPVFHHVQNKLIVNRSERYQNPYISYYFLKYYDCLFSGTQKEREVFNKKWKLKIPHLIINDFLELAQAIKQCRLFVGNQSGNFWIAEATKSMRLLELCEHFPNTWPHGDNGLVFSNQQALEYYVKELMK